MITANKLFLIQVSTPEKKYLLHGGSHPEFDRGGGFRDTDWRIPQSVGFGELRTER